MADPRPPILEAPVYVAGAKPSPQVVRAAQSAASPVLSTVGIALVGAIAGYFAPKILDRWFGPQLDPYHGEPVEVELDDAY